MNPFKNRKGLGRGLSSLIGETKVETQKNHISISDLVPNKYQPRKIFDETNLDELANSIKERGIIQPIAVRKDKKKSTCQKGHKGRGARARGPCVLLRCAMCARARDEKKRGKEIPKSQKAPFPFPSSFIFSLV